MAKSTIEIKNPKGEIVFTKENFEYPDSWSKQAASTFAKHYSLPDEQSVSASLDRILSHFRKCNVGFIKQAILDQKASFNSPVMFNFGTCEKPLGSACFILSVNDDMDSISELYKQFMHIYKYGAGAGLNPSGLRGSMEKLSRSDGTASGPLSFMKVADCIAQVVRSGGRQRRAAKGLWFDCDHPDVEMFIDAKWKEEEKARVLEAAGYGSGIESESYNTVAFQNVNMSVRLTDAFMGAVINDGDWNLTARKDGQVVKTLKARDLLMKIASAAHKCGDPGVQFHDTINRANPFRSLGKEYAFNASNPCAEFMFKDNSACNLASINLNKFYDGKTFDFGAFVDTCIEFIYAMDEIIDIASYPTEKIAENSIKFRPLGLGYTGLGTVLMRMALPYGSPEALEFVLQVTSKMTQAAWLASHELFMQYGSNLTAVEQTELTAHVKDIFFKQGLVSFEDINGFRNSQVTLLAPTGTISFIMDTGDSTGIEPVIAVEAHKTTIGGQVIQVLAAGAEEAMKKTGAMSFAHPVFATSIGDNCVSIDAHIATMAEAQKHVSGSISKCVTGNTNLLTENGIVEISDFFSGQSEDSFSTLNVKIGSECGEKLAKDFYYGGKRKVITVDTLGGRTLSGTENHMVRVAGKDGLEWKRMDRLAINDYIAYKIGSNTWSSTDVSFSDYTFNGRCFNHITIPKCMNERIAYFLGSFIADGSIAYKTYTVSITKNDDAVLDKLQSILKSEFGLNSRRTIDSRNSNIRDVVVSSKEFCAFLTYAGIRVKADKVIPWSILKSSKASVAAFMQGLFHDGYVIKQTGSIGICMVGKKLVHQIQVILDNFGIQCQLGRKYNKHYDKYYYHAHISGEFAEKFCKEIPFDEQHKALASHEYVLRKQNKGTSDVVPCLKDEMLAAVYGDPEYHFMKDKRTENVSRNAAHMIRSKHDIPALSYIIDNEIYFAKIQALGSGEEDVFDVHVPDGNTFIGNGILNHNTVNLPSSTTVQQIYDLYLNAWRQGLKAVAVYRAGSKMSEPLSTKKAPVVTTPHRTRMPSTRPSVTHRFEIMGMDGYITLGYYDDGRIGEVFAGMQKVGSTVQGLLNSWSIMVSNSLQYGVPIEDVIRKFKGSVFEPAGITDNPDIQQCSSILDYVVRFIETTLNKEIAAEPSVIIKTAQPSWFSQSIINEDNVKTCPDCGNMMVLTGRCHLCTVCGTSGGCS